MKPGKKSIASEQHRASVSQLFPQLDCIYLITVPESSKFLNYSFTSPRNIFFPHRKKKFIPMNKNFTISGFPTTFFHPKFLDTEAVRGKRGWGASNRSVNNRTVFLDQKQLSVVGCAHFTVWHCQKEEMQK